MILLHSLSTPTKKAAPKLGRIDYDSLAINSRIYVIPNPSTRITFMTEPYTASYLELDGPTFSSVEITLGEVKVVGNTRYRVTQEQDGRYVLHAEII